MGWNSGSTNERTNTDISNETYWHNKNRNLATEILGTEDSAPFSVSEITTIVMSLSTKKAPCKDLIVVKIIKEDWPKIQNASLGHFNCSLSQMVFPRQYKKAQIRVHFKGGGKDKSVPKF